MTETTSTEEQQQDLIKNWQVFRTQVGKLADKTEKLNIFLDAIEEEAMIAPASTRTDLVCSYAGGLVEHSLRVLSIMAKLRKVYALEKDLSANSVILVSLLHDIGKIGDETKPYYSDQPDEWRRNKLGQNYEITEKFIHMPVSQLSLRWLSNYSFKLDLDEWYTISSIRDHNKDESTPTKGEPMLAVMLQQAVRVALMQGKNKKHVSLITG